MHVLEQLPERLMKELQYKTQKKMIKEQKKGNYVPPPIQPKPIEAPPKPKIVIDCLTIELKAHVSPY